MCKKLFYLIFLVIILCMSMAPADAVLVSHWKFDEGSGNIAYDSVNGNYGTIHGATWITGQIGGALSFDGTDDYVQVSDDPSLRFSQYDSFSISFWTKPLLGGYVLTKMRASRQEGYFGYEIYWSHSMFCFLLEKSYVANVYLYTPEGSAPAGYWYFVAAVYDNKNMQIYLNGELSGSKTFNYDTGITKPDKDLTIGVRSYDSTLEGYFNGIIDDVRIYNHAIPEPATLLLLGLGSLIIIRKSKVKKLKIKTT